jgi:non-heme chloroperoxidase
VEPPSLHRTICVYRPDVTIGVGNPFNLLVDLFWFQGLLGGAKAQYETTYSWELDYTADIAKCDKPLLVIHCEDDQIVPIGPTGRRVPSVVPHAILKVYEGGAHGIAIIDPERVNADFLAFIKGEMKK